MERDRLKGCQILGLRYDLLGAKLNSFLNALRIGTTYDLRARAFWALTGPGSRGRWARDLSRPDELFSDSFIAKYLLTDPPSIADIESQFIFAQKAGPFQCEAQLTDVVDRNCIIAVQERMEVITFPWESAENCKARFASLFVESIELSHNAKSEIDSFHSSLSCLSNRPVGIHVRRGDIIRHPVTMRGAWRGMYQPDEIIFATLEKIAQQGRQVILFCNDEEFVARANSKFQDVILENKKSQLSLETNILTDFMDIYKMSSCEYIIGSGVSAFSAVARNIANSQLVRFDKVLNAHELRVASDSALARVLNNENAFLCEGDMLQTINFLLGYFVDCSDKDSFRMLTNASKSRELDILPYIDSLNKHKNFDAVADVSIGTD